MVSPFRAYGPSLTPMVALTASRLKIEMPQRRTIDERERPPCIECKAEHEKAGRAPGFVHVIWCRND